MKTLKVTLAAKSDIIFISVDKIIAIGPSVIDKTKATIYTQDQREWPVKESVKEVLELLNV